MTYKIKAIFEKRLGVKCKSLNEVVKNQSRQKQKGIPLLLEGMPFLSEMKD
jgi:hypothetical protein